MNGTRIRIFEFSDGSSLEFAPGGFDDWCVFYNAPDGTRKPPRDVDYFRQLVNFSEQLGYERVYNDYVSLYNIVGLKTDGEAHELIKLFTLGYPDELQAEKLFCTLYMAMLAEERRKHTKLGKRIKRLGIHALLVEKKDVLEAANFMRGMKWDEIDILCNIRGF